MKWLWKSNAHLRRTYPQRIPTASLYELSHLRVRAVLDVAVQLLHLELHAHGRIRVQTWTDRRRLCRIQLALFVGLLALVNDKRLVGDRLTWHLRYGGWKCHIAGVNIMNMLCNFGQLYTSDRYPESGVGERTWTVMLSFAKLMSSVMGLSPHFSNRSLIVLQRTVQRNLSAHSRQTFHGIHPHQPRTVRSLPTVYMRAENRPPAALGERGQCLADRAYLNFC